MSETLILSTQRWVAWGSKRRAHSGKGFDWGSMDRLHEKGFIHDPKSKARSVILTEEGESATRELFERHFGR